MEDNYNYYFKINNMKIFDLRIYIILNKVKDSKAIVKRDKEYAIYNIARSGTTN